MKRVECTEGEPFILERRLAPRLRLECARLQRQLRSRFVILNESAHAFTINGIIGVVHLDTHTFLDIAPKTAPQEDWISATLDLLAGSHRVDISDTRAASLSSHRRTLLEAVASIYATRLEHAIRREGPILVMRRQTARLSTLRGKLDITEWARRARWQPHVLPVTFSTLAVDNEFSQTLTYVAQVLADMSHVEETRERLRRAARALRPGCPAARISDNQPRLRQLPQQWSAYQPAWSLAISVLSRKSLLGSRGQYHGYSFVVEAWPLLESLLQRSITSAALIGRRHNRNLTAPPKGHFKILSPRHDADGEPKSVEPDGRLADDHQTVATFEAKYKKRQSSNWPAREDIYQALVAAAAAQSPLSVLVYPEAFDPVRWNVSGLRGWPVELVAVGLGPRRASLRHCKHVRSTKLSSATASSGRINASDLAKD
jgi:5-methylcytosine-specific restriction endonuclease McrBC regulatory subunit McrC